MTKGVHHPIRTQRGEGYQINTSRPRQNGRHFADDTFKRIFLNGNVRISIKISLKFVPNVQFDNIPALVQIMAWRRLGDKPLSGPMMVILLTHICVTRPQWVNDIRMLYPPFIRTLPTCSVPRACVHRCIWWLTAVKPARYEYSSMDAKIHMPTAKCT